VEKAPVTRCSRLLRTHRRRRTKSIMLLVRLAAVGGYVNMVQSGPYVHSSASHGPSHSQPLQAKVCAENHCIAIPHLTPSQYPTSRHRALSSEPVHYNSPPINCAVPCSEKGNSCSGNKCTYMSGTGFGSP
jgi:hypothetical protein